MSSARQIAGCAGGFLRKSKVDLTIRAKAAPSGQKKIGLKGGLWRP